MYGGLFGDLPSAKKQKQTPPASSSAGDTVKATNANDKESSNELPSTSSVGEKGSVTTKTVGEPAKGNNNKKSQFLQMVGKSGTTMAFVPTAALKSKRKKSTPGTTTLNSNNKSTNNNAVATNGESTKPILPTAISGMQQSSFASVTTTTTTTRIAASKSDKSKSALVVDIHGIGTTMESSQAETTDNSSSRPQTASEITPSEEEKITDPYDPYVPNDLLEYWETLAAKKHREKMERDALEALEHQKVLRKQLEEDRQALLLHNDATGDAAPLRSMGRGRGVSNLPAWLVEKQKGGSLGAATETPSVRGRGRGVSNLPAWLVEKQRREASGGQ